MADGSTQLRGPVRPVQRAYQQVAEQMRRSILSGSMRAGDRLPKEAEIAATFGTSRSTVREALRLLASEQLIVTRPGAGGGSTVASPDPGRITDSLHVSLTLLIGTRDLTPEELVAVRSMLEVPAATMAARLRTPDDVSTLRSLIPADATALDADALFEIDRAFHEAVVSLSGNRLLPHLVSPIYQVSAHRFRRSLAPAGFWRDVINAHTTIVDAIERCDDAAAGVAMAAHLRDIEPTYHDLDRLMSPDTDRDADHGSAGAP